MGKNICEMARQLSNNPEFTASNGWCQNFIRRYGLSDSNPKLPKQQSTTTKAKSEFDQDFGAALGYHTGVTSNNRSINSNTDLQLPNDSCEDMDKNMLQLENRILKS